MNDIGSSAGVAAVRTQMMMLDLSEAVQRVSERSRGEVGTTLYWFWVALIGVTVVAAGAGFAYCKANGYDGFTGNIRVMRDANGFEIGTEVGCY